MELWEGYLCTGSYGLVDLVGLSLALIFWQLAPAPCIVLVCACFIDLLMVAVDVLLDIVGLKFDPFMEFRLFAFALVIMHFLTAALIVWAVFMGRGEPASQTERFD